MSREPEQRKFKAISLERARGVFEGIIKAMSSWDKINEIRLLREAFPNHEIYKEPLVQSRWEGFLDGAWFAEVEIAAPAPAAQQDERRPVTIEELAQALPGLIQERKDELKAAWERGRDAAARSCSAAGYGLIASSTRKKIQAAIEALRYSGEAPQPKGER